MRSLFIILVFFSSAISTYAQHQISGVVKDKADGSSIAYATITLLRNDSSMVTGCIANEKGTFSIKDIKPGSYLLQVSFLGYEKKYLSVNVPQQSELGTVSLLGNENKLSEVVVTADRPFVVQRSDRYVVNVGSHIQTGGQNALEVLGNTPGVLVNPDGHITVMGSGVDVYIDGKPSRLSGEQLKTLLTTTQGGTIDRIEVITNPSARYDASGGSIIDIKTKKGLQHGINGSVEFGYRQGRKDRENTGFGLNYRNEKLNLYGNYNITRSSAWQELTQVNQILMGQGVTHTFNQQTEGESVDANFNQQYKLGADYSVNQKNTIGVLFSGYHTGDAENMISGTTTITPALANIGSSTSQNLKSNWNDGKMFNLNYQGQYSKPGQQLNIDLDYGQFKSKPYQFNENRYFDLSSNQIGNDELLRNTNPQTIDLWSAKADYTQPVWENAKIEAGIKTSRSKTDNNLIFENYSNSQWTQDPNQSNYFVYSEQVHALYASLTQSIGKWSFQAGLRGEYTGSKGEQKTTGAVNDSSYFNLFPTAYINYSATEASQLNMSYGRRIMRPNYGQLNPFEVQLDAYSFTAGNPYLKPMIMDNFSFSYMHRSGLMLRLAYNNMQNLIMQTPVQVGERYGLKYDNFGKRSSSIVMANYRKSLFKWWTFNLMVQGAYFTNTSDESQGEFNNDGFVFDAQLFNSFNITSSVSAELTAMYTSAQKQGYYEVKPMSNVSVGIRKSLLKNKLSISLNTSDLFYSFKTDMTTKKGGMDYRLMLKSDSRWVNLSIRYIFGSDKVKGARNRATGVEDEKQRINK